VNPAELIESETMCAEDFGRNGVPKEPRVTIADVKKETSGRKWALLIFKEKWAKPLKVNATHRRALCLMFGDRDTDDWKGKQVDLHVVRGVFPNGKTTAVRIKGSPNITRASEFTVQKFGGGKDKYVLQPTGKNVELGPGVVRFGQKAGHYGKAFADFEPEKLREVVAYAEEQLKNPEVLSKLTAKAKEDLEANVREIHAYLAEVLPPAPEPVVEEEKGEELPV
jgi:hypothetical protein